MRNLNEIMVFAKVAQVGSFSQAAQKLGLPVSTVSRRVSDLEKSLGLSLLQRTTRRLQLTPSGEVYYRQCRDLLQGFEAAENQLLEMQASPQGSLKISVAAGMTSGKFMNFLSGFLEKYPLLEVDVLATNLFVDLVAENVDVAVRAGFLKDSSLMAKKLGTSTHLLVASPDFVRRHGKPSKPRELADFNCLTYTTQGVSTWQFLKGNKEERISVQGKAKANDMQVLYEMARRGHGIALLPDLYAKEDIEKGRLLHLLPDWAFPQVPVHAVYVNRRFLPARISVFLKALEDWPEAYWR